MRRQGGAIFEPEPPARIAGEQNHQQQGRADRGEKQAAERLFGRYRVEDHGDRRRQQDAERAARRDDSGREAARIAALAHFRNAGRADRRAGRGRGPSHGGEQRAGEHIGDAEPARNAVHPGMECAIEVLAGA